MIRRSAKIPGGWLHVEVPDVERVVLDELAARLNFVAHELHEHLLGLDRIGEIDAQQLAVGRIHRSLKQFLGIHFAQSLETVNLDALFSDRLDAAKNLRDGEQWRYV